MDEHEINRLADLAKTSRELAGEPEHASTNIQWELEEGNVKNDRVYRYTFYGEVRLAALIKPTKEGHRFLVYYDPTGVTFGFKTWPEANIFARLRGQAMKAVNKLWGY